MVADLQDQLEDLEAEEVDGPLEAQEAQGIWEASRLARQARRARLALW